MLWLNKKLCDQLLKDLEASKDTGGRKMLSKYLELENLTLPDVFSQLDWEYVDAADLAAANTLTIPPM